MFVLLNAGNRQVGHGFCARYHASDRFCGMMSGINSMPDLRSDRRDLAFAVLVLIAF